MTRGPFTISAMIAREDELVDWLVQQPADIEQTGIP